MNAAQVSLRPARLEDVPALASMNARLNEDEGSRNPMGAPALEERARGWLADSSWNIAIAERAGSMVGYIVYQRRVDEYDPTLPLIFIRQIFVERDARCQKVGRAMVALALEAQPPRCRVVIDVLMSNPRAMRFWKELGFEPYALTMVRAPIEGGVEAHDGEDEPVK